MSDTAFRIPRSTCKLFGAIKALGTMKRTAILVHGPKGCVYHINYILGMRGDRPAEIYSTCLDEQDIIFGAERKLVAAIEQIDRDHQPDLICVLSCCASGIIGEDVASAVRTASISARALAFDSGGFEGDHTGGYSDSLAVISRSLATATGARVPRSVNLLGLLRAGPDLAELKQLLSSIDVIVLSVFTAGATLDELSRAGDASLNLVTCETSGLEAAKVLEQRFGTPYCVVDLPIGKPATERFLDTIDTMLGGSGRKDSSEQIYLTFGLPQDFHIALFAGPTRAIAFSKFLHGLNCPPRLIVLDFPPPTPESIHEAAGPGCRILVQPEYNEIQENLDLLEIDLILGGMFERPYAAIRGIPHIDIMHGSQKTFGYPGAELMENLLREAGKRHRAE
jgi:nitrogenase molybdenum-cofactor synthesis protein NifE